MKKLTFFANNYSFDKFLEGYNLYLENIVKKNAINFEKFSRKNLTLELVEILEKMIDDYNK